MYEIVKKDIYEQILGPNGIVLLTDCRDKDEMEKLIKLANSGIKKKPKAPAHRRIGDKPILVCPVCDIQIKITDNYCRSCGQKISHLNGDSDDK